MSYNENEIRQKLEQIVYENTDALNSKSCESAMKQLKSIEDLQQYFFSIFYEKPIRFEDYGTNDELKKLGKHIDKQREGLLEILRIEIERNFSFKGRAKIEWIDSGCKISNAEKITINVSNFFERIEKFHASFEQCSFTAPSLRVEKNRNPSFSYKDSIKFDNLCITRCSFTKCLFEAPVFFTKNVFQNHCTFKSCCFQKKIFFEECDFQDDVNFAESQFCDEAIFKQNKFNKKSFFIQSIFATKTSFKENDFGSHCFFTYAVCSGDIEFIPDYPLGGYGGFRENAYFSYTHFKAKTLFCDTIFYKNADFAHAIFEGETNFDRTQFKGNVFFEQLKLDKKGTLLFRNAMIGEQDYTKKTKIDFSQAFFDGDIDLSGSYFYGDTYFHRAVFGKNIQFYRSYFEGIANFYFVDFRGIPNFSMCVFNQPKFVNFVGVILPQNTIDKLRDYINQKAGNEANQKDNIEKGRTKTYLCIQHSLNIRDSFRVVKETLITQGNLLDTQQWQKLELYAKELECQYRNDISTLSQEINELKKQEKIKNLGDTDSIKTLEINKHELSKNRIEFWQLWFYRLTSDHHTNLAQIMTNIALLVALFGIFSCGILSLKPTTTILNPKIEGVSVVSQLKTASYFFSEIPNYSLGLMLASLSIVFFCGIYTFLEFRRVVHKKLFGFKIVDLLFLTIIIGAISFQLYEGLFTGFVCFSFIGFYFFFSQRNNLAICIFSYMVCAGILFFSPTLLIPFVGTLFSEGFKTNIPTMQSLSVVYCILMFLMLFSLKKTAQKNSIIPS